MSLSCWRVAALQTDLWPYYKLEELKHLKQTAELLHALLFLSSFPLYSSAAVRAGSEPASSCWSKEELHLFVFCEPVERWTYWMLPVTSAHITTQQIHNNKSSKSFFQPHVSSVSSVHLHQVVVLELCHTCGQALLLWWSGWCWLCCVFGHSVRRGFRSGCDAQRGSERHSRQEDRRQKQNISSCLLWPLITDMMHLLSFLHCFLHPCLQIEGGTLSVHIEKVSFVCIVTQLLIYNLSWQNNSKDSWFNVSLSASFSSQ